MKTRRSKKRLKQICLKTFATGVILVATECPLSKGFIRIPIMIVSSSYAQIWRILSGQSQCFNKN